MVILLCFCVHWYASLFLQSFFHHRYGAHRQFELSPRWERFFHLSVYLAQGASYLDPRGYILLHRMHHAYSDTSKDPHSPTNHANVVSLTWATKQRYDAYTHRREEVERRLDGTCPEWPVLDRWGGSWPVRLAWIAAYTIFYVFFAPSALYFLLLPAQCLISPVQGALVNWCGHRYGYRNFDTADGSTNALPIDFLTLGELCQNNHHACPGSASFAARWFEVDFTYQVIRFFERLGIVAISVRA